MQNTKCKEQKKTAVVIMYMYMFVFVVNVVMKFKLNRDKLILQNAINTRIFELQSFKTSFEFTKVTQIKL